jgi:Hypothetical protein (DUF2513)
MWATRTFLGPRDFNERDMDLIRDLLLKIEETPPKSSWRVIVTTKDDTEAERIFWHLALIEEAGFIKSTPVHLRGHRLPENIELVWAGHDSLDSVRDPKIWAKTKEGALAAGGFTFDLLKDLAKGFVKKQIEERTGVTL